MLVEELKSVYRITDFRLLYRYYHTASSLNTYLMSKGALDNIFEKKPIELVNFFKLEDNFTRAKVLSRFMQYQEAADAYEKDIESEKKRYGEETDHLYIAYSLNNLGSTLYKLSHYDKALAKYQESLEMKRRIYKGDHPDIAGSLNNLGNAFLKLDSFEKALERYEESLEMRRRIYKGDHPDIASSLMNIGITLTSVGSYSEALENHKKSLEMKRRIYKGDHPDIASSLMNIGVTLTSVGSYSEALEDHKESLEMRWRIYKGDHPTVADSLNNIGNILGRLGRYEEALQYQKESLSMMRRIHKGDHVYIASSLKNVGHTLESLGRYAEALNYFQQSLEMMKKVYPENHPEIKVVKKNVFKIKDYAEIEKLIMNSFKKLKLSDSCADATLMIELKKSQEEKLFSFCKTHFRLDKEEMKELENGKYCIPLDGESISILRKKQISEELEVKEEKTWVSRISDEAGIKSAGLGK
jgi:tetratricopeptide (TPR) repeat protein